MHTAAAVGYFAYSKQGGTPRLASPTLCCALLGPRSPVAISRLVISVVVNAVERGGAEFARRYRGRARHSRRWRQRRIKREAAFSGPQQPCAAGGFSARSGTCSGFSVGDTLRDIRIPQA
jgi:hypothetical protein